MRRNPQFKTLTISEASKLFEDSLTTVSVSRIDRKRHIASFEKNAASEQFGQYVDTEVSHKFKSYCEALVRTGFMDAKEIA